MSQQITVILMIDIEAALNANKLEGNLYMIDNLRTEGSEGEGTGHLVTAVKGNHWSDGSQAGEAIFNWLISGIDSLPKTLPRQYHKNRTRALNKKLLAKLNNLKNKENLDDLNENENLQNLINMTIGISKIKDSVGNSRDHGIGNFTVTGKHYIKGQSDEPISYLDPIITDITGEAVDNGVIFPAQYGTPVSIKDGWYWSASTDTSKTGTYSYTLHITLYKPKHIKKTTTLEWEPIQMTYESNIKVSTSTPKVNGFTNGSMGELPIY